MSSSKKLAVVAIFSLGALCVIILSGETPRADLNSAVAASMARMVIFIKAVEGTLPSNDETLAVRAYQE